ncbi:hypothetical protein [Mesorhizobium sp. ZC-5]|uniref:hypothetical protein n=1 Tax=Mesorhizobium sp. ZC-5 TaxID=2986066 RepID=UPI0021E9AD05|nr:hypothetical protein [Mesorhizobium sp. ZC-5]MCV3240658.1 hypothetical protein [Mesorhizobium sp. ZC-5]
MSQISRRKMLIGSVVLGTKLVRSGMARQQEASVDLAMIIEAHRASYATFMEMMRKPHGLRNNHTASNQAEEKALLAVCGFPAVGDADRRVKATYLLQLEARGELDLREHMQAVLLSMM